MPATRSGEVLVYLPKQGRPEPARSKPVRGPPASTYTIEIFGFPSRDCMLYSGRPTCGPSASDSVLLCSVSLVAASRSQAIVPAANRILGTCWQI